MNLSVITVIVVWKGEFENNYNYLGELHDIHALSRVPMEESPPPEHGGKLICEPFECLLNGGTVI